MFRPGSNAIDLGQPANPAAPLNRGLQGWWLALPQTNFGGQFLDLLGARHGTATGASRGTSSGRPGGMASWTLGAVNTDRIALPRTTAGAADFSFGAWVNASNVSGGILLDNYQGGIQTNIFWLSGAIKVNYPFSQFTATATLSANIWSHIFVTRVGSTMSIYINGLFDTSASVGASDFSTSGFTIGNYYDGTAGFYCMKGSTDDIRIYTRGLSADEVLNLYNASRTGYQLELNRISRPIGVKGAAAATFKAAWARRSNQVIGVTGAA